MQKWGQLRILELELKETCVCMHTESLQSCPLCNPMDCSPPDFSVHGILQARILECIAMPSSRGSFWPRIEPTSPDLQMDSSALAHRGSPKGNTATFNSGITWFIAHNLPTHKAQAVVFGSEICLRTSVSRKSPWAPTDKLSPASDGTGSQLGGIGSSSKPLSTHSVQRPLGVNVSPKKGGLDSISGSFCSRNVHHPSNFYLK